MRVIQNAYFSLLTHTKQLLSETFCHTTAGILARLHTPISAIPRLMDLKGLRVTQNAYFSLLTHTKQLLSMTFCYTLAGIGASFQTQGKTERQNHGKTDGQTDVNVEIVI